MKLFPWLFNISPMSKLLQGSRDLFNKTKYSSFDIKSFGFQFCFALVSFDKRRTHKPGGQVLVLPLPTLLPRGSSMDLTVRPVVEFIQHLNSNAYIKVALVLFVGVPVVATVVNMISQVRLKSWCPAE